MQNYCLKNMKMPRKVKATNLSDFEGPWNIEYGCVETIFGEIQLGTLNGAVCFLYFASSSQFKSNVGKMMKRWPKAEFSENAPSMKILAHKIFLDEDSDIDVVLSGTEFQNTVWRALLNIPKGEIWTYSECSEGIGKPSAVRAVANAVANNEIAFLIPCHRVVSKDGNKLKYRWGAEYKKKLLSSEGVKI